MFNITDTGQVFVAVLVGLALVGVLAEVGVLVADLTRLAVKSSVVTTRATTKTFTSSAVETVIVSLVAHLVEPLAVLMVCADHLLALVGVHVALVVSGAVVVLILTKTSTPRNTLGLAC